MRWEDECRVSLNNVKRLLPRFFDPLEDFTAPEYLELARSLLELYRCEHLLRLERRELERIDDALMMLRRLIKVSAEIVIEKYRSSEYREKLRESLRTLSEKEVEVLSKYLKQGLQLVGYNLMPLVPFLSDKLFIQYLGSVLKMLAIVVVGVKKYWAKRAIRKLSIEIESLARELAERLDKYGRRLEIYEVGDVVEELTSPEHLMKLTERLYGEQIYANTPEVIAFAEELQKLRGKLLKAE